MTVFSRQKDQEIPKNQYTKWFDYDKIKGTLSVRTRRTGDYLILPSGGSKTIARYMIDEKIPKEKREQILLLAEGSHVLWVVGFRISEYYKIEEHTENILQVTCDGGKGRSGGDGGLFKKSAEVYQCGSENSEGRYFSRPSGNW